MAKSHIKYLTHSRLFVVIAFVSLLLNILFVSGYLVTNYITSSGELDTAQVNYGVTLMCSDEYRQKYEQEVGSDTDGKKRLALLNFSCSKNGAGPYFEKGYNEYIRTLGLNP